MTTMASEIPMPTPLDSQSIPQDGPFKQPSQLASAVSYSSMAAPPRSSQGHIILGRYVIFIGRNDFISDNDTGSQLDPVRKGPVSWGHPHAKPTQPGPFEKEIQSIRKDGQEERT